MLDAPDLVEPYDDPARAHVEVAALRPAPWPTAPVDLDVTVVGAGRCWDLEAYLEMTSATALVVVVDGVLVHEWYLSGVTAQDRLLGNSATKSVLAQLTGLAARSGALPDLDVAVSDLVGELRGSGYHGVTVRQLLTMTSGVGWIEDYHDPSSPASLLRAGWLEGLGGSREQLTAIPTGDPPGVRYAYCSPDSMVLDWVRELVSGHRFADALGQLWFALGGERAALVGLDAPTKCGGVALAAGGLAATARDWARLGMLQVDGTWAGETLLERAWVEQSCRPTRPFLRPGRLPSKITTHAGFGYHWWPLVDNGSQVMADGMRGQFVYVDRPRRTVVVQASAWPYDDPWWDRQCRDLGYLALPAIAESAWLATRT
ncbi:MAG: serine hydrolase [Actinomycetota bacterium]|nr:serine hydrolase [Actinomycetota bacterium]MDQ6933843.1 serine hydrolase [Actinomycetota bacterium]